LASKIYSLEANVNTLNGRNFFIFIFGTGGALPALVAQYWHWWRSTGTGGAVPALVAQ
jgi:hypothetical protein